MKCSKLGEKQWTSLLFMFLCLYPKTNIKMFNQEIDVEMGIDSKFNFLDFIRILGISRFIFEKYKV